MNERNPIVYIIIVNWNGYEDTIECIKSLEKIDYNNYRIVVVDNGSNTNEIDNVAKNFPEVHLIKNEVNLGFSGGNNIGMEYAVKEYADFVLLLNNDTVVEKDFLNQLVENTIENEKIGIAVPKINYYSNRDVIWYAGGYINKLRGSGFTSGVGELDSKYLVNKYVTFATGCCLLIKIDVIKQIGPMDEKYFLYLEDVDYCLRTLDTGYKILFVAKSKIYHKESISTKKNNAFRPLYYVTRNRLYFVSKFYKKYIYITFTTLAVIFLLKSFMWLITGQRNKIRVVQKSFTDFIYNNMGKCTEI